MITLRLRIQSELFVNIAVFLTLVPSVGSGRRTTTSTLMNAESSRSHLICSLVVKMTNRRSETVTVGKLTLVDLAGSEVSSSALVMLAF